MFADPPGLLDSGNDLRPQCVTPFWSGAHYGDSGRYVFLDPSNSKSLEVVGACAGVEGEAVAGRQGPRRVSTHPTLLPRPLPQMSPTCFPWSPCASDSTWTTLVALQRYARAAGGRRTSSSTNDLLTPTCLTSTNLLP